MAEFVSVTTDEHGVATLRLERPPVNAIDAQVCAELAEAGHRLTADDDVRAVVLWGGPKVFAGGADIKAMVELEFQELERRSLGLSEALSVIAAVPKATIAAINGYALGGGCELALAADFRFAADNAQLGQPEILLGVIPGAGGTQRLPRLVGLQKAKEMVYGGGFYSAADALAMGLVDRVHGADEVYDKAVEAARGYARGPYALRLAKQAIDEGAELDLDTALRLERRLFAACFASEDQAIGMRSFLDQGPGKAEFTGR